MAQQFSEQASSLKTSPKTFQEAQLPIDKHIGSINKENTNNAERLDFELLQVALKPHAPQTALRARLMSRLIGGYSVLMVSYALLIFLYYMPRFLAPPLWLTLGLVFLPVLLLFQFDAPLLDHDGFRRAAKELFRTNDIRAVCVLTDMLSLPETSQEAMRALIRLLPQLRASDGVLLTKSQRDRLQKELGHHGQREWFGRRNPQFAVAILQSLEQIGDADVLPIVQALAVAGYDAVPTVVRSAARACLPYLEVRAAEQQSKYTLLRASNIVATGQNILLRPAEEAAAEPRRQLLRASFAESTPTESSGANS